MSTQSIAIPSGLTDRRDRPSNPAARVSSSSSSSYSSSPRTPQSAQSTPSPSAQKQKKLIHERRPSLLSSAILKEECTVINIGDPEGPPRLVSLTNLVPDQISYTVASQGYIWNPEIFLPSYVDHDYIPLDQRREPVHEITVTDEEINAIFPQ
ncbi:hypothetical protein M0657_004329 [Pyricularia oryzae]|uniref:Uncharacterized protein n=1 Tax=Pyricularia oryzae TaxID=318829 RepID=A0A4P7NJU9_PYROR|nr:hypothetical protein M9X92_005328 [Pyricularia oryzae]KAI7925163.1 hypothetical protein M0657_004329 [Pyricularia oryzae]QBZ62292.1 hypothetical protein PoMZ_11170 [Pyricularia oryzae]